MENSLSTTVASRIRDAHADLAQRWLQRTRTTAVAGSAHAHPAADGRDDGVTDHANTLVAAIADYVSDPIDESPAIEAISGAATHFGRARQRGAGGGGELLECFDALADVLLTFSATSVNGAAVPAADAFASAQRIAHAAAIAARSALSPELIAAAERTGEREERLRRFRRLISHELKNRVGATLGAGQLLQEEWLEDAERRRFAGMVTENVQAIQKVLENMSALAAVDSERRKQRDASLREIVSDVFRQLGDIARARGVELRGAHGIPDVKVNAGATELSLATYLFNSIRYSDPSASHRWAEVSADVVEHDDRAEIVVRVQDNGIGVPVAARERLFERFFRAHEEDSPDGAGLGLHLTREAIEALGGRAWAEFGQERGSTFAVALPLRRENDQQNGGVSGKSGAADVKPGAVSAESAAAGQGVARRRDAARVTASD